MEQDNSKISDRQDEGTKGDMIQTCEKVVQ